MTSPIQNVSDTALWVATYRAMESERKDALFRDPLARVLAGPEGERIARGLGSVKNVAWSIAVRTRIIDEMILRAVSQSGADRVVNLASGLDTRPYRLDLPEGFLWVEADLPGILLYKEEKLSGASAKCRIERIRADLAHPEERRRCLERALEGARRAVILTEGLLCYLDAADVGALATDIRREKAAAIWITDLFSREFIEMARKSFGRKLERGNAPLKFGSSDGSQFFGQFGWRESEAHSVAGAGARLGRDYPGALFWRPLLTFAPRKIRDFVDSSYQLIRLEPVG